MIHSDQLILLRKFQAHFDSLWAQGLGGIGNRSGMIAILHEVTATLRALHLHQKTRDFTEESAPADSKCYLHY